MPTILTWLAATAAAVLAALVMSRALMQLPPAPGCPRCRAVTLERGPLSPLDRLWALAAATPPRACGRCGWAGRMRWRAALQRAGAPRP